MQKQIVSVLLAAGAVSATSPRQPSSGVQRRQSEEAFQQIVDDCLKAFEPESPTYVKDINDCVADALGIQRRQFTGVADEELQSITEVCSEQHVDDPVGLYECIIGAISQQPERRQFIDIGAEDIEMITEECIKKHPGDIGGVYNCIRDATPQPERRQLHTVFGNIGNAASECAKKHMGDTGATFQCIQNAFTGS